ncbi:MAG: nuclease-related domain-containing protein [Actinomycetota bacterium]
MLAATERSRSEAVFEEGVWQTRHRKARAERQLARARRPRWRRLLALSSDDERLALQAMDEAQFRIEEARLTQQQLERVVHQQEAGIRGEQALADGLAELSDDWTMLRGYRNGRGEADSVLVGPLGLWAVEVKNRNVRLNVDGDRLWCERLDRWGNVVGSDDATDRSGRTWARQVTDVADDLARWLRRRDHEVPIRTAVMVLNQRATLGMVNNPPVDLVGTDSRHLLEAIQRSPTVIGPTARQTIVELIRRDHRHHHRRRRR